jgi:hypothetical protein
VNSIATATSSCSASIATAPFEGHQRWIVLSPATGPDPAGCAGRHPTRSRRGSVSNWRPRFSDGCTERSSSRGKPCNIAVPRRGRRGTRCPQIMCGCRPHQDTTGSRVLIDPHPRRRRRRLSATAFRRQRARLRLVARRSRLVRGRRFVDVARGDRVCLLAAMPTAVQVTLAARRPEPRRRPDVSTGSRSGVGAASPLGCSCGDRAGRTRPDVG